MNSLKTIGQLFGDAVWSQHDRACQIFGVQAAHESPFYAPHRFALENLCCFGTRENNSKLFGGDFFANVVNVFISMEFRFESRTKFLFKEKCCLQSCIKSAVQRSEGFRVGVLTFRPSSINLIIFSRIPESLFGCSALAIE